MTINGVLQNRASIFGSNTALASPKPMAWQSRAATSKRTPRKTPRKTPTLWKNAH
jgi:hypothetical protein